MSAVGLVLFLWRRNIDGDGGVWLIVRWGEEMGEGGVLFDGMV